MFGVLVFTAIALLALSVWALCRAAGDADRHAERLARKSDKRDAPMGKVLYFEQRAR